MNKLNKHSWNLLFLFSIPLNNAKFSSAVEHLALAFRGLGHSIVFVRNKRIELGFLFDEYNYHELLFFSILYRDFFEIAVRRFSYLSSGSSFSKFQQKTMKAIVYFIKP